MEVWFTASPPAIGRVMDSRARFGVPLPGGAVSSDWSSSRKPRVILSLRFAAFDPSVIRYVLCYPHRLYTAGRGQYDALFMSHAKRSDGTTNLERLLKKMLQSSTYVMQIFDTNGKNMQFIEHLEETSACNHWCFLNCDQTILNRKFLMTDSPHD